MSGVTMVRLRPRAWTPVALTLESVLGWGRFEAGVVSFVSVGLSVHGWIFFLTYPVNPPRELWLERPAHRFKLR